MGGFYNDKSGKWLPVGSGSGDTGPDLSSLSMMDAFKDNPSLLQALMGSNSSLTDAEKNLMQQETPPFYSSGLSMEDLGRLGSIDQPIHRDAMGNTSRLAQYIRQLVSEPYLSGEQGHDISVEPDENGNYNVHFHRTDDNGDTSSFIPASFGSEEDAWNWVKNSARGITKGMTKSKNRGDVDWTQFMHPDLRGDPGGK